MAQLGGRLVAEREVFSSIPSSNKTTLLLFLPVSQHGKNSPFNYEMIIILLKNFDKFYNLYLHLNPQTLNNLTYFLKTFIRL